MMTPILVRARRFFPRPVFGTRLLAVAVLAIALAGCRGDEAGLPSEPGELSLAGKGNCPQEALQLIDALFDRGLKNAVTQQCNNIERQFSRGKSSAALSQLSALIGKILTHHENGQTKDTTGPLGFGSGVAVLRLIGELNEIVGLPGLGDFPAGIDPFAPGGAVETCESGETCEVIGGDEFSGFLIPSNVQYLLNGQPFNGPVTFFIAPLPSNQDPFPEGFELGVNTFPLYRFFGSIPEGITFSELITGGVCVLDPPHSLAPDPEDIPDLRLAHLVDGVVVPLPLRDASGLVDCSGVNATVPDPELTLWRGAADALFRPAAWLLDVSPLYARPGALGGGISSFSPFGAILPDEDETTPPTVDVVEFPEFINVDAFAPLQLGTFSFTDPDADVSQATVSVVDDPSNVFPEATQFQFDPDVFGLTDGTFTFGFGCPFEVSCLTGTVGFEIVLEDQAGNVSEPASFSTTFFTTPVIDALVPAAAGSSPKPSIP